MTNAAYPARNRYLSRTKHRDRRSAGYGPFRYAAPAGWLLLASLLRVLAFGGAPVLVLVADILVLVALIDATSKTIESLGGQTALGELSFAQLCELALKSGRCLLPFILGALIAVPLLEGLGIDASALRVGALLSVDGLAFDTGGFVPPIFNAMTGLLAFMLVVSHGIGAGTSVVSVLQEIARRKHHLLPAFLACFLVLLVLSGLQDWVRPSVYRTVEAAGYESPVGKLTFFSFVVGFAAVRLTLLVLVFAIALRRSYRWRPFERTE